jgi:Uma2 family endonuclease
MGEPALKYYTIEDYLAFERASEIKHELFKGEIFDMAGASLNHNKLQINFTTAVGSFLKGKSCDVFGSDLRIHVPFNGLFTYPDAIIICSDPQLMDEEFDTLLNPSVIVEILSPATQRYDRGEKFMLYRSIPSLQEYILIDSESIRIEHYKRNSDNTWLLQEWKERTDTLMIDTIGLSLSMEELYSGVRI